MATIQNFKDLLTGIDTETNRIAGKIDELVAQLAAGGLTQAEESEVEAGLTSLSARLKTIGSNASDPIPPVPPETI